MNRLFDFSTGMLTTFAFSSSLVLSDMDSFLIRQLLSVVGGVLSAVVIAWLKRCWDNRRPPSSRN